MEAVVCAAEAALGLEAGEDLSEALVAYAECGPKVGPGHGALLEDGEDSVAKGIRLLLGIVVHLVDNREMGMGLSGELYRDRVWRRQGSMFRVQDQAALFPEQIEVAVGPCMEVAGATERLTRLGGGAFGAPSHFLVRRSPNQRHHTQLNGYPKSP